MRHRDYRPAVTLVEVLAVIAILAVLFGLIMAAIQRVRPSGERLDTLIEIQRMDAQLKRFYATYEFYPPSQIRLCERFWEYDPTNSEVDARSLRVLQKMFGDKMWSAGGIDWDGDSAYSPPVMLTGDQCLVFFLGGIPDQTAPGVRGFASSGNPAARRGAPLFDFDRKRLVKARSNNFYSYLDPYRKQPYAYFTGPSQVYNSWTTLGAPAHPCDCPNLNGTDVWPYLSAAGTFHKPNSFQIISAGKDGVFGPGDSILTSGAGAGLPLSAQDDLTNFSPVILRGY